MTALRRSAFACLVAVVACSGPGAGPSATPSSPSPTPSASGESFRSANVVAVVRYLAGTIGPREATSESYRRAGAYVESRLRSLGYVVTRQRFHVPGGLSNYAPVTEGDTFNVIATPVGFDASEPHYVAGAHLDTVPQAPGAVDNAAGVGIVLELARLASSSRPSIPIVFVAFGAEEARSPYGGLHGSRFYVSSLSAAERKAVRGAISIDRVGTSSRVPICTATDRSRAFADRFFDAARRAGIPTVACTNTSSDHVSFTNAGISAIRIGPDDFRQYHTSRDVPAVLVPAQVERALGLLRAALG